MASIPLYSKKAAPRIQIENGGLQRRITESIHEYADSPDFGERRACVNSGSQAVFLTAWVRGDVDATIP